MYCLIILIMLIVLLFISKKFHCFCPLGDWLPVLSKCITVSKYVEQFYLLLYLVTVILIYIFVCSIDMLYNLQVNFLPVF